MTIHHPEIRPDFKNGYLWRYVDLFKLIDFLSKPKIFFNRLDQFEDPLEGLPFDLVDKLLFTQEDQINREEYNTGLNEDYDTYVRSDSLVRIKLKEDIRKYKECQFASSWHFADRESYAMWKVYSGSYGAVLKINAESFLNIVIEEADKHSSDHFTDFAYDLVQYKNIWPLDFNETSKKGEFSALKKDKSYEHEKEFRFLALTKEIIVDQPQNFKFEIPKMNTLDWNIVTNPFMAEWQEKAVEQLCEKFGHKERFKRSETKIKLP